MIGKRQGKSQSLIKGSDPETKSQNQSHAQGSLRPILPPSKFDNFLNI